MILEHIQSPADVKSLEREQLPQLCQELPGIFGSARIRDGRTPGLQSGGRRANCGHPSRLRYSGRPSRF